MVPLQSARVTINLQNEKKPVYTQDSRIFLLQATSDQKARVHAGPLATLTLKSAHWLPSLDQLVGTGFTDTRCKVTVCGAEVGKTQPAGGVLDTLHPKFDGATWLVPTKCVGAPAVATIFCYDKDAGLADEAIGTATFTIAPPGGKRCLQSADAGGTEAEAEVSKCMDNVDNSVSYSGNHMYTVHQTHRKKWYDDTVANTLTSGPGGPGAIRVRGHTFTWYDNPNFKGTGIKVELNSGSTVEESGRTFGFNVEAVDTNGKKKRGNSRWTAAK
jgi:hypothetical protein